MSDRRRHGHETRSTDDTGGLVIARWTTLLACALLLVGACSFGGGGGPEKPDYTPVPDDELFARVADLPGVEDASGLSYNGTWPESTYVGEIVIAPDVDAQDVLDRAHAILRQGRFQVTMNVGAVQDDTLVDFDRLGGPGTTTNLEKRYGPQPGDGTPPGD